MTPAMATERSDPIWTLPKLWDQALADPLNLGVLGNDEKDSGAFYPLAHQSSECLRHGALIVGNEDTVFGGGLQEHRHIVHSVEAGSLSSLEIYRWLPAPYSPNVQVPQIFVGLIPNRHR